jgi:hypothetical protein
MLPCQVIGLVFRSAQLFYLVRQFFQGGESGVEGGTRPLPGRSRQRRGLQRFPLRSQIDKTANLIHTADKIRNSLIVPGSKANKHTPMGREKLGAQKTGRRIPINTDTMLPSTSSMAKVNVYWGYRGSKKHGRGVRRAKDLTGGIAHACCNGGAHEARATIDALCL